MTLRRHPTPVCPWQDAAERSRMRHTWRQLHDVGTALINRGLDDRQPIFSVETHVNGATNNQCATVPDPRLSDIADRIGSNGPNKLRGPKCLDANVVRM